MWFAPYPANANRGVAFANRLLLLIQPPVSQCASAFKLGVVDFWKKPIPPISIYQKRWNCSISDASRIGKEKQKAIQERVRTLTDRETKVFRALVSGQSMKEIAGVFGTSFQAIARHRQHILAKLCVENDVVLCKLAHCYLSEAFDYPAMQEVEANVV